MPYPSPFTNDHIKTATLRVVKFHLHNMLSLRELTAIHGMSPEVLVDEQARRLVINLKMFLVEGLKESYGATKRIEYHADWRQAFKARWFNNRLLRWLIRRYPIKMTVVDVPQTMNVTRVCPHLPITEEAARDGRAHLQFLMPQDYRGW